MIITTNLGKSYGARTLFSLNAPQCVLDDTEQIGACTGSWIQDVDFFAAQFLAEFLLQNRFHTIDHKIDYRLRRINDAVSIGYFDGETLKKFFVNRQL